MVSPLNQNYRSRTCLPAGRDFKKQITQIIILVSGFWFLVPLSYAHSADYIRVAVLENVASVRLKIKGFYEVIDSASHKSLYRGKHLNTTVTLDKGGISLGAVKAGADNLLVKSDDPDTIIVNGRTFRGNIQFIKKGNLSMLVVDHIDLEDYIKGILYNEASHYWPIEALKAQAVASRTYAVYQMQENRPKDYDVTADIYSQVYGGRASERYRTSRAVAETAGKILHYQNKVFPAYFHATCGGHTEDASLLWNIDIAPLKGVVCDFCKDSPHFNWHNVLTLKEIAEKLDKAGHKISKIKDIIILNRDGSGRVIDLKITSLQKDLKISAKDFRNIIGPNIIRSANFQVRVIGEDAVFEGFGWGHGVGLCQWGAYFMAKAGYKYEEILKYYYPQADVKTIGF